MSASYPSGGLSRAHFSCAVMPDSTLAFTLSDSFAHRKDLFLPLAVLTARSESTFIPICIPYRYPVTILRSETFVFVQAVMCIENLDVHDGATRSNQDATISVSSTPPSAVFNNAIAADLSPCHQTQILSLVNEFVSSLNCKEPSLGRTASVCRANDTGSHAPFRQRAYCVSAEDGRVIREHVDDMLQRGVIQPS